MMSQEPLPFDELEPDPNEVERLARDQERRVADLEIELAQYENDLEIELKENGTSYPSRLANLIFWIGVFRAWISQTKMTGLVAPLPLVQASMAVWIHIGLTQREWIHRLEVFPGLGPFDYSIRVYTLPT